MSDAGQLVGQIRADLKAIDEKITRHRYLGALEAGSVASEKLKIFAAQQYHIVGSDLRSVAILAARHGHLPSRSYLMNILQGENAAFEALLKFGQALGMNEDALKSCEPIPGAFGYCAFVAWLGAYGSDAELAAGFLVNFAAWGANCGRISRALKAKYGLTPADVEFFAMFANLPPSDQTALSVIQGGLDRGVPPALIHRAARLLQAYELAYWNTMAEGTGI
jgi:thiaminase